MLYNFLPDNLFNLFASSNVNRDIYFKTLMILFEEYKNKSDILTREECSSLIIEKFERDLFLFQKEEGLDEESLNNEIEYSNKILTNLIRAEWLSEDHDTQRMVREITMPTYSSEILGAFYRIMHPNEEETEHYIFDIYSNLNSVLGEEASVKYSCLINAENKSSALRRSLQDILHNIKKLYEVLMEKQVLSGIMDEHFENYTINIVDKSYHRLKTENNLYKYRQKIMSMVNQIRFDEKLQDEIIDFAISRKSYNSREEAFESIRESIDNIKNVFDNIEKNITNIDIRHRRYVNTAVARVQYLQTRDKDLKDNLLRLLKQLSKDDSVVEEISKEIKIKDTRVFNGDRSFRMPPERKKYNNEEEKVTRHKPMDIEEIKSRIILPKYKVKDIEDFALSLVKSNITKVSDIDYVDDDIFDKLLLAYDYGIKRGKKKFGIRLIDDRTIIIGKYKMPNFEIQMVGRVDNDEFTK